MLQRTHTLVVTAMVAALVIPALVLAAPGGGHGRGIHRADGCPNAGGGVGPMPGGHGLRMLDRMAVLLDLTAEQEAQLEAIREATRTEIEPLAQQLRASRDAWRDAHQPGTFDEQAFREHVESQSTQHNEMAVIAARAFNQAWQVLTPEQQAQLESWRSKLEARRDGHGGRFGGHPVD
jgi:Spy/CpxP family protein refolding chaperone